MADIEQQILASFKRNDKQGTGTISKAGLESVLRAVGVDEQAISDVMQPPHCTAEGVQYEPWLRWLIRDQSGQIRQSLLNKKHTGPLGLTDAVFSKFDADGNGELDVKEISNLMREAFPAEPFTKDDEANIMNALDLNHDGKVGTNELRAFLRCYDPIKKHVVTRNALVIIDVQNDFITGTLANKYNAKEVVPKINAIRDKFDLVVISYDWHPFEHCSFVESVNAGKVPIKEPLQEFTPFSMVTLPTDADRKEHQQMIYPRHAVQDSEGGALHPDLVRKDTDKAVYKGTKANIDSYSAFFDNCKANDIGLTKMLEEEGITHVFCVGLVLDICVKSTALHGAELGFKVSVIEDCCRPLDEANVESTRATLREAGCHLMNSDEVDAVVSARSMTLQDYLTQIKECSRAKKIHENDVNVSSHAPAAGA